MKNFKRQVLGPEHEYDSEDGKDAATRREACFMRWGLVSFDASARGARRLSLVDTTFHAEGVESC
jgi:hypothetical protein